MIRFGWLDGDGHTLLLCMTFVLIIRNHGLLFYRSMVEDEVEFPEVL